MSAQKWRVSITALMIFFGVLMYWNTFKLWTMSSEERQEMQENSPGDYLQLQQRAIRLGLDLQGGIHTVLRVELDKLNKEEREGAVDRAIQILRNRIDGLGVAEPVIQKQGNDRIIVDLPGYADPERAEELIGQTALLEFKLLMSMENAAILLTRIDSTVHAHELSKNQQEASDDSEKKTEELTETIALDSATTDSSPDDILAELLGDRVSDTMDFSFDESVFPGEETSPFTSRLDASLYGNQWPGFAVSKRDKPTMEKWLALPQVKRLMPVDVEFAWSTRPELQNAREIYYLYLLKRKVEFIGKYLEQITLGTDQFGAFVVNFSLSGDGQARFAQLTGANIGKPLAIVIDGKVESAPTLQSKIRKNGQITMSSASIKEVRNLEIVLKAGALPAPVVIIEKNIVGATLGTDSINKGLFSALVGLAIVLLYIGVYYRLSGVIADIGLIFNIFFLLAVLAGLGATLTMPGIAGIILTIGISIDANILIFERIREELRTGKTVRAAIDAGYERAFVAILDSHVTTLITAGALFLFGSGPIRGFAVTLFWGVLISLYTAYVITKAIFNIRKQYQTLSI